jgi:hypothetical protein
MDSMVWSQCNSAPGKRLPESTDRGIPAPDLEENGGVRYEEESGEELKIEN